MTPSRNLLQNFVASFQSSLGFGQFGLSPLQMPLSFQLYQDWIDQGYHGEMDYLKRHLPAKQNSKTVYPFAESAIVFAFPYFPWPTDVPTHTTALRTALYSQGGDYHHWIAAKLQVMIEALKTQFPDHEFMAATDSKPVLERDLAYRAGLGWVGKNTCLIHPKKGSLFFLAEILCSFKMEEEAPASLPDFCGTCTRCIDICPTQAIESPRKLNAQKCISYWTIESKSIPPESMRNQFGDWFFGCDLCQTVCPWNQKIFKHLLSTEKVQTRTPQENNLLAQELAEILMASQNQLAKKFQHTALSRARGFGLKRNALIVIANRKIFSLYTKVQKFKDSTDNADLQDLAKWTLQQLQREAP